MEIKHKIPHTSIKNQTKHIMRFVMIGIIIFLSCFVVVEGAVSSKKATKCVEFEKAVAIIKKYEGLHRNKGDLIGYGHKILPGEPYKRNANLSESQADALLRKDLSALCERYRSFGSDSLILAALAYNTGIGTVAKSSILKKLKAGDREIKATYLSYSKYRGKTNTQLMKRRTEEFETLFVP